MLKVLSNSVSVPPAAWRYISMNTWNNIQDALCELEYQIKDAVTRCKATECNLDIRCGTLFRGQDFLATRDRRLLDYYGGFEYVDPECIQQVGGWTLYSADDDRVLQAMMTLEHKHD